MAAVCHSGGVNRSILVLATVSFVALAACTSANTPQGNGPPPESDGTTTQPDDPTAAASEATEPAPQLRDAESRPTAPEFPDGLTWLNTDRPLTMEELRGKVVVLDFWTYGCINCIHIIPDLKALEEDFGDTLVVIGVHSAKFENEGNTDNIREIILRYELEHPVINDADFAVWQTWGAQAWPTLVLIDPRGGVVGSHAGEGVYEVFRPAIAAVAAESPEKLDLEPLEFTKELESSPETLLRYPGKVLAAPDRLFVSDTNHHRIVMSNLTGEVLDVFGSGQPGFVDGIDGSFAGPQGLAVSDDGSTLYVADTLNHAIRSVDIATGSIVTIAGTGDQGFYPPKGGPGRTTALYSPWDVAFDEDRLVIAMAGSHQIWSLDLETLVAEPYAGSGGESVRNGPVEQAELAQPSGVEIVEGTTYFADSESSSIRFTDGDTVGLLAGTDQNLFDFGSVDGVGADARFQHPLGVTAASGVLYVADTYNSRIRAVDIVTGAASTVAGSVGGWRDGPDALFNEPGGIDELDGVLYVADTNNHSVRRVNLATGEVDTMVFFGLERFAARPGSESYRGAIVTLAEVTVAPGPAEVELSVDLPPGYKINPDAPSRFEWSGEGVTVPATTNGSVINPSFPRVFDIEVNMGGDLIGDLSVVYCDIEAEAVCLFEQVRVIVPLIVSPTGDPVIAVRHTIALPEGF